MWHLKKNQTETIGVPLTLVVNVAHAVHCVTAQYSGLYVRGYLGRIKLSRILESIFSC
jgi:hypothetical protein